MRIFVLLAACSSLSERNDHFDLAVSASDLGARPMTMGGDLCAGMISDKAAHPMTPLAKPALGKTVVDAEFGTTIRRISAVAGSGANAAIVPMYTTISAWNADESLLILYDVSSGNHQLYDGKSYQFLHPLDINPADVEQVYWHVTSQVAGNERAFFLAISRS
jgi:hypothetical protein